MQKERADRRSQSGRKKTIDFPEITLDVFKSMDGGIDPSP